MDYLDSDQRLLGYKTLNLLNCNGDASLMSTVLYPEIASMRIPTPEANFVNVVINGESWGGIATSNNSTETLLKRIMEQPVEHAGKCTEAQEVMVDSGIWG